MNQINFIHSLLIEKAMQIHEIKVVKKKNKKRVGRGGKRGTYSGRGVKGQKARGGHRIRPQIREFLKRIPKRRGYNFGRQSIKPVAINLELLNKYFQDGEVVSARSLLNKKLISKTKGRLPKIKILGKGELSKKLIFKDCLFSQSAKEKISKITK